MENDNDETVTLSKEAYEELLADQRFLEALHAAGVGSWGGYDFAREAFDEEG